MMSEMNNGQVEILLVDDNLHDVELTMRALKKSELVNKLVHVDNGADALDYIFGEGAHAGRVAANIPKVILLDLNMPKVNGWEVLARIKADPVTRQIPVVILTSSAQDPDIKECYRLGANSYVVKPVEFDDFAEAIRGLGLYWVQLNKVAS